MRAFMGRDVGIGDLLLVNAVVEAFKQRHPEAHLTFGCGPEPIPQLLETNPHIDELLVFPDNGNPVNALRRAEDNICRHAAENAERYDQIHLLFPHDHFAAECLAQGLHLQDYFARMCGVELKAPGVRLWTTDEDRRQARALVEEMGLEGCVAVSHKTFYTSGPKQWPLEQFQEVVDRLTARGHRVAAFGSLKDEPLQHCINVQGRPLRVVIEALASCRLMLGLDTGLTHAMDLYDIPVVALHTSSRPEVTGTRSKRATFLRGNPDQQDYTIKTSLVVETIEGLLECQP